MLTLHLTHFSTLTYMYTAYIGVNLTAISFRQYNKSNLVLKFLLLFFIKT